ncbi:MAG: hypothetical protein J6C97_05765, partial [Clostridia bacterium]|nr:hypothetical protein [Clostridia bacterium]
MSLKRKIAITILALCFIFATLLGVVGYKANTTLTVYAANELTETEYYAQLTHYGSSGTNDANKIANSKNRARISFSIKMATGTNITFKGDTSVYKWAVNEMSAPYAIWGSVLLDTGWKTDNSTYAITQDCYPTIVITRNDSAVLTDDELYAIKDWFTVSGTKVSPTTTSTSGSLTTDEYNSQVASFGSLPWQNTLRRARLTIAIRLRKGAVVTFKGNTSTYNWGVIETNNPSQFVEGAYLDSGWLGTATSYTTKLDGVYLVLTIKGATDDSAAVNLSSTDLTSIHSLFSITATKLGGDTIADVEQKDYAINSIAHRGVPYYAPENTLPAYELAADQGFKMVECDISFTSDGEPVLLHDDTIARTSNGSGNVSDMTTEQLKTYDFGSWMGHEYAETKIPTLAEFLDCCITNNLHPYIELKGTITDEQAQKLIDVVTNKGMLKKVTWISYGTENLAKIATLDSTARVGRVASNSTSFTITEDWLETQ